MNIATLHSACAGSFPSNNLIKTIEENELIIQISQRHIFPCFEKDCLICLTGRFDDPKENVPKRSRLKKEKLK